MRHNTISLLASGGITLLLFVVAAGLVVGLPAIARMNQRAEGALPTEGKMLVSSDSHVLALSDHAVTGNAGGRGFEVGKPLSPPVAANRPTVRIGARTLKVGSSGSVDLWVLDFPEPGLGSWSIDIFFDPLIVDADSCMSSTTCNADFGGDANERVRFACASGTGFLGDTKLGSISFSCVAEGTSLLTVGIFLLADATIGDHRPVEADTIDGSVACGMPAAMLDDVSCDGSVNSVDALFILQFLAGLGALSCPTNADTNQDLVIDPIDAALLLQFIAGFVGALPP